MTYRLQLTPQGLMWESNSLSWVPRHHQEAGMWALGHCIRMIWGCWLNRKICTFSSSACPPPPPPPPPSPWPLAWILIQQFWGPELPTVTSPKTKESFLIGLLGLRKTALQVWAGAGADGLG